MSHFQTAGLSPANSLPIIAEPWWQKYLAVPYKEFGRDLSGWDCWGCVKFLMETHLGIELPNIDRGRAILVEQQSQEQVWHEVDKPLQWDVVCLWGPTSNGRMLLHVGLMVDDSRLFHCERGCGTVCVPVHNPTVKDRLGKFYRHDSCLLPVKPIRL